MEDQNVPAQGELPSNQPSTPSSLPDIAPGLDKKELRQKMIEILASTANGCLQELGYYPGLHAKLQELEKRANEWQSENTKLYQDNQRLFTRVNQLEPLVQEKETMVTTMQRLLIENAALKNRNADLEEALRTKAAGGPLEVINSKYNNLLVQHQNLASRFTQLQQQNAQLQQLVQQSRMPNHPTVQSQPQPQVQQQQHHQPPRNVQQSQQPSDMQHQIQQQQRQQQQPAMYHQPHPSAPPHSSAAGPSTSTAKSSHTVAQGVHPQHATFQQPMQPGPSSNRKPSGSMAAPSPQQPVHMQGNSHHAMQQQSIPVPPPQYHPPSAPPTHIQNPHPHTQAHAPQRANTVPSMHIQYTQRPQPPPQTAGMWLPSPHHQTTPSSNHPQPASGLWINTSGSPAHTATASHTPMSRNQTPVQTPNSASFPPPSPHGLSQLRHSSATPSAASRLSSFSQASPPPSATPSHSTFSSHTPSHSPPLKRNSLSISDMPGQAIDDPNKRPRIDGPSSSQGPSKSISGLPSPMTPSVQHASAAPSPQMPLRASPETLAGRSPIVASRAHPPTGPATPAQSQSPNPRQAVIKQSPAPQQAGPSSADAMLVDAPSVSSGGAEAGEVVMRDDTAEAPLREAVVKEASRGGTGDEEEDEDEDDDDEEVIEVGPDGLRLVSDCLDQLFGKDRNRTFECNFCVHRLQKKILSEPPATFDNPSDDLLVQHLIEAHKAVWDLARAVDD